MKRTKHERTRPDRRWSQKAVSLGANIPQPTISLIEQGRLIPTPAQLKRLADVFGVAPEDLLKDVVVVERGPSR